VLPAFADLTSQDLDKIRLIVKAEITKTTAKIETLDTRLRTVDQGVAWVRGKLDNLDKQISWLIALIIIAVGIPQIVVAWRSRKDRAIEKQIETLTQEIETLKQQRIVNP
jgi:chaperonin cofactor prefoldin